MAGHNFKRIRLLTPLAVLILILVLVDVVLTTANQSARRQLAGRQQIINQGMQMEAIYREIVQGLAGLAVKTNDEEIKKLLASQGVNVGGDSKAAGGAK